MRVDDGDEGATGERGADGRRAAEAPEHAWLRCAVPAHDAADLRRREDGVSVADEGADERLRSASASDRSPLVVESNEERAAGDDDASVEHRERADADVVRAPVETDAIAEPPARAHREHVARLGHDDRVAAGTDHGREDRGGAERKTRALVSFGIEKDEVVVRAHRDDAARAERDAGGEPARHPDAKREPRGVREMGCASGSRSITARDAHGRSARETRDHAPVDVRRCCGAHRERDREDRARFHNASSSLTE